MKSASIRTRRPNHRTTDRLFLYYLIGGTLVMLSLIGIATWAANRPVPSAPVLENIELLPLAKAVSPIHGIHDMARLPNQAQPTRTMPAGSPQANIDLPLQHWDWGTIPKLPPVRQSFPIQNTGNQPLLITNLVTSCGCTTADLSSSVIPPGQRADLIVTFDPNFHETVGQVTRLIWLETNDPDLPLVELRLDANVLP